MTPSEFARLEWAHLEKLKDRHKSTVSLAWQVAAFVRWRGKLPNLSTYLSSAKRLSSEEKKTYQSEHERLVKEMGG